MERINACRGGCLNLHVWCRNASAANDNLTQSLPTNRMKAIWSKVRGPEIQYADGANNGY